MKTDHKGTFESADGYRSVKDFEEGGLDFFGQFSILRGGVCEQFTYFFLYKSAEGFDEVIGQGEGIVSIAVMNAECRQEAGTAEGPGYGSAEDDIAVIEPGVGRWTLPVTSKGGVLEEGRPEFGGGLGFDIFGVS